MINFDAIGQAIWEAAAQALGGGAETVATRARALAPVRHIFADGGYSIRPKSASEMQNSIAPVGHQIGVGVTRFEGYSDSEKQTFSRTVTGKRPPRNWHARRLAAAAQALADYDEGDRSLLTRRGAYEVRQALNHPKPGSTSPTGRLSPSFATWGHLHVGGRLRGEIYATPVRVAGQQAEAWVISPTRYAKYQEFGTRHNAAHPFLRPAAAESQPEVVSQIAAAVKEASRTGVSSMQIEIEVRL
jgi:HK97 gp10 family phage protein